MSRQKVIIGKIVAPHGVRGDARVIPLTDFLDRFSDLKEIYLDNGTILAVERAKLHKNFILLKFRGLDSANDIEPLRNTLITVNREDAVVLPEGHYYVFDIIGLDVYTETGEHIGTIADILQTGSNDVYVAEKEGCKQILIPALKKVVLSINLAEKKMTVRLLEEWEGDHED